MNILELICLQYMKPHWITHYKKDIVYLYTGYDYNSKFMLSLNMNNFPTQKGGYSSRRGKLQTCYCPNDQFVNILIYPYKHILVKMSYDE